MPALRSARHDLAAGARSAPANVERDFISKLDRWHGRWLGQRFGRDDLLARPTSMARWNGSGATTNLHARPDVLIPVNSAATHSMCFGHFQSSFLELRPERLLAEGTGRQCSPLAICASEGLRFGFGFWRRLRGQPWGLRFLHSRSFGCAVRRATVMQRAVRSLALPPANSDAIRVRRGGQLSQRHNRRAPHRGRSLGIHRHHDRTVGRVG
jgi:hypothetical protein